MLLQIIHHDEINRPTQLERGDYRTDQSLDFAAVAEECSLDKAGIWKHNYRDDPSASGVDLSQPRMRNKANEVDQIDGAGGPRCRWQHDQVPIPGDWSDDFELTVDASNRPVAADDGNNLADVIRKRLPTPFLRSKINGRRPVTSKVGNPRHTKGLPNARRL